MSKCDGGLSNARNTSEKRGNDRLLYIYNQDKEPPYEVISNPVDGLLVVFAIGSSRIEIVNQLFVHIQTPNL